MAITPQNVIDGVKDLTQDVGSTRRWADAAHIVWLNEALRIIWRDRPDVQFRTTDGDVLEFTAASASALTTPLFPSDQWLPILVDYVAYRCFDRDASDPENLKLSKEHYAHFMEGMGTNG